MAQTNPDKSVSRSPRVFRPTRGKRWDSLVELANRYYNEAHKAAQTKAYYAACILIGSALEASLLAMTTLRSEQVETYISGLQPSERPPASPLDWGLNQLLTLASALGWFPARSNKYAPRRIADWTQLIRELRNLVHSGKHLREYPQLRIGRAHWTDVKAVFELATSSLLDQINMDLRAEMRRKGIVPLS